MHGAVVRIPASRIRDWPSFHDVFAEAMGFPDFYGRNMNAWIDCLTYRDEDDGMARINVDPGEVITLLIEDAPAFMERCPEQFEALVRCSAFVNWRRVQAGNNSILALAYHESDRGAS
jgi:barstar (barnase inhibitor)